MRINPVFTALVPYEKRTNLQYAVIEKSLNYFSLSCVSWIKNSIR